jgi:AMP nucleosidase
MPDRSDLVIGNVRDLVACPDADSTLARINEIYDAAAAAIRERFRRFEAGEDLAPAAAPTYPYVAVEVGEADLQAELRPAFGVVPYSGVYGATLTRPDLFGEYYREQLGLLIEHHRVPVHVGISDRPIALPYVIDRVDGNVTRNDPIAMRRAFHLPDLSRTDDHIANGTFKTAPGQPFPLSLFSAERVDLSLARLKHYTGTSPEHFQRFVLFTNYQRYVEGFATHARAAVARGEYSAFVSPGDHVLNADGTREGEAMAQLPQMPAYHLVQPGRDGITLVHIGVGPSNARTISDHIAVLRPHCWLMIGHCGGLQRSQSLGDYVLAHAYQREDHVLDQDLPTWVPVPPIAEIQIALQQSVARVTGLEGLALKTRMRTGTVVSTDNRNWELRYDELFQRFSQSRAIAIDMESATIAANGFRLRVPYGTLLCVSDKPMHGEIKLAGMATAFYRERVNQHLTIALETVRVLKEKGVAELHSRKLRSLDEPPFR